MLVRGHYLQLLHFIRPVFQILVLGYAMLYPASLSDLITQLFYTLSA
jgi:hypothetical protein